MRNDFSFKPTVTKEEIADLPIKKFSGEIHDVDSIRNVDHVVKELRQENTLGFDTETKPSLKKVL
jgi:ribonuclease D